MKEKKTHAKAKKPPMFDFTPLKSRGLRVLMVACAFAALGIYAPVFYLVSLKVFIVENLILEIQVYQGYKEGLEDSALVLLQTFMGFASALGCVGFGLVTVRPSSQCLISRQYLCQAAMVGIGKFRIFRTNKLKVVHFFNKTKKHQEIINLFIKQIQ